MLIATEQIVVLLLAIPWQVLSVVKETFDYFRQHSSVAKHEVAEDAMLEQVATPCYLLMRLSCQHYCQHYHHVGCHHHHYQW